jgi:hypothetical protein
MQLSANCKSLQEKISAPGNLFLIAANIFSERQTFSQGVGEPVHFIARSPDNK